MEFTFDWKDVFLVLPAVALFLASLVPLTIKVLTGNRESNSFATMSYGLAGVVVATGLILSSQGIHKQAFDGMLVFDGISTLGGLIVVAITALALIYGRENHATNNRQFSEYVFLMLNAAAGMLLVTWAHDLIFFFIGVELMSLSLYVLIAISSEGRLSKESSFKYFILGSFASAVLLYGIAFIFGTVGSTNLGEISKVGLDLIATNRLFLLGLILVILGLAFKVSVFPLHAWTPDVYQGAPTPVTAFMAAGVKASVFFLFLRLMMTDTLGADEAIPLVDVIQWLAALTMLVGNIAAVMQSNLKRMLAYSSVAHSGYMLMGLLVAGVMGSDPIGSTSVIFYAIGYTVMTLGAFGVVSVLEKDEESAVGVEDLTGLARRRPWLAACLTLFLLSLAGIPPTIGFFAKFFVFSAAIKTGFIWLAIWGVLSSVISVYYYLRPIVMMYMKDEEGVDVMGERSLSMGMISLAAVLVVAMGIFASPVYEAVTEAIQKAVA